MKESQSRYQKLLQTHPLFSQFKRQKTTPALTPTKDCGASRSNTLPKSKVAAAAVETDNDDDDNFTLDGLDDPEVPVQWQPLSKHRWKEGDTVELVSSSSELSDFAIIVGTNDDGTYNIKNILTGKWKKSVGPDTILGTYDDLALTMKQPPKQDKHKPSTKNPENHQNNKDDHQGQEEDCHETGKANESRNNEDDTGTCVSALSFPSPLIDAGDRNTEEEVVVATEERETIVSETNVKENNEHQHRDEAEGAKEADLDALRLVLSSSPSPLRLVPENNNAISTEDDNSETRRSALPSPVSETGKGAKDCNQDDEQKKKLDSDVCFLV